MKIEVHLNSETVIAIIAIALAATVIVALFHGYKL